MVANHQHIQMLINGVDGVGPSRIGGCGQNIGQTTGRDDIRRVSATGTFSVKTVDRAAFECGERVFDKAGFIQGVGVNGDLHIVTVGHRQTAINRGRGSPPVLMEFKADGPGTNLLLQRPRQAGVALAQNAKVHWKSVQSLQHPMNVPLPRSTGSRTRAGGGSGTAADEGRHTRCQSFLYLLRANVVDVGINTAGRQNLAFPGDNLSTRTDDDIDIILDIGIARLANAGNAAILDADIRLINATMIDNQRIGNHQVHRNRGIDLALAHPVPDHLPTAKFDFFAIGGQIGLDLNEEISVA